jgi:hypothetical protein
MSDDDLSTQEIKDVGRAFRERWPIGNDFRTAVIRRLLHIVADKDASTRDVIAASRALLQAEKQNQDDDWHDDETEQQGNRFLEIARQLGLEVSVEPIPEERPDSDSNPTP